MTTSEHGTTTFLPLPIDLLSAFFEEMSSIPPKLSAPQNSYRLVRIFALVVAIPLSIFTFWLLLINGLRVGFNIFGSGFDLSFAVAAFICWWFALRGEYEKSRVRMMFTLLGALIVGGIGFAAGFFGPIIFTPKSNQGPLLGIFFTGPLGFVAGAIIGVTVGYIRTHKIPD